MHFRKKYLTFYKLLALVLRYSGFRDFVMLVDILKKYFLNLSTILLVLKVILKIIIKAENTRIAKNILKTQIIKR